MKARFLIITALLLFACNSSNQHKRNLESFEIHGHRGSRGHLPENSIPGFVLALEQGAHVVELDLVVSEDSQLVVNHEPWLNPGLCTGPNGEALPTDKLLNLFQMRMDSIRRFDCGSKGNPKFPDQKALPVSRSALWEVVQVVEHLRTRYGDSLPRYNIELKFYTDDWSEAKALEQYGQAFFPSAEQFASLVIGEVRSLGVAERVSLQSFSAEVLEAIHGLAPEMQTVWLTDDQAGIEEQLGRLSFKPTIYSPNHRTLNEEIVRLAHERGVRVIPWTVNEESEMQDLINWGVDGIITDYPDRLYKLVDQLKEGEAAP